MRLNNCIMVEPLFHICYIIPNYCQGKQAISQDKLVLCSSQLGLAKLLLNDIGVDCIAIFAHWNNLMKKSWHGQELSVDVPSQWETTLHCNVISHWLGTYKKWSQGSFCGCTQPMRDDATSSLIGWAHTQNDPCLDTHSTLLIFCQRNLPDASGLRWIFMWHHCCVMTYL